jgi:hypothetical protein
MSAVFSEDRKYRYRLDRDLASGEGTYVWIGKNPSMADETRDDNSVSRVMNRAREAGFRKFVVVNLYAYVSTDPRGLLDSWEDAEGPLGPDNLSTIAEVLEEADYVLCAWGSEYIGPKQAARVLDMIGKAALTPHCLGLTDDGSPVHPARLRADTTAIAWDQEKVRRTIEKFPKLRKDPWREKTTET